MLSKVLSPEELSVTIHLHPDLDLSELPIKSYYRFAMPGVASGGECDHQPLSTSSVLY